MDELAAASQARGLFWPVEARPKKCVRRWTAEEDDLLTQLVRSFGVDAWAAIAQHLPDRTRKQVRGRRGGRGGAKGGSGASGRAGRVRFASRCLVYLLADLRRVRPPVCAAGVVRSVESDGPTTSRRMSSMGPGRWRRRRRWHARIRSMEIGACPGPCSCQLVLYGYGRLCGPRRRFAMWRGHGWLGSEGGGGLR
jgi:hypothetical protein